MNKAQAILAAHYDNRGEITGALIEACEAGACAKDQAYDATRYVFDDNSVIVFCGGGVDEGFPLEDCWCWQGAGHTDDCEHS